MRVHKTPWLRRLGVLVVIASLAGLPGSVSSVAPAGADELADKKAEAARIAAQVEAEGLKVSVLAERLNEARLRADKAAAHVAATQAALARTDALVAERRETLKAYVVQSYIKGGGMSEFQMLVGGSGGEATDIAIRSGYVKAVTAKQRAALSELADAREQAEAKRRQYEKDQKDARVALAEVDADRREAADAARQAQATLDRVQGELAALVEAESQRRAEEAARLAQAELAARQAREAREATRSRPAASPSPAPSGGGSGGGGGGSGGGSSGGSGPAPSGSTGTDPGPAPAPNGGAAAAVEEAKRQIGKPYEWGADGPDSFDCSGLTQWAWRAGGVDLPHSSRAQYSGTARVAVADIQPGDLTFYGDPIHHVGIYVGNGTMVEASQTGRPVRYASIYRKDLVGVGRVSG